MVPCGSFGFCRSICHISFPIRWENAAERLHEVCASGGRRSGFMGYLQYCRLSQSSGIFQRPVFRERHREENVSSWFSTASGYAQSGGGCELSAEVRRTESGERELGQDMGVGSARRSGTRDDS